MKKPIDLYNLELRGNLLVDIPFHITEFNSTSLDTVLARRAEFRRASSR